MKLRSSAWLTQLSPGGVERLCHELNNHMVDEGLAVETAYGTTITTNEHLDFDPIKYDTKSLTLPFSPYAFDARFKYQIEKLFNYRLTRYLKTHGDHDVFHGFGMNALPGIRANIPTIATVIGVRGYDQELKVLREADGIVAPAHRVKSDVESYGIPSGKVSVIHQGVNVDYFGDTSATPLIDEFDLDPERNYVVSVHNLHEKKATEQLVRAFDGVAHSFPSYDLVIAGDGPRREAVNEEIANGDHEERIHQLSFFGGELLKASYALADVFVLPGRESTRGTQLPLVIFEAMANELPIISADVGSIYEVIDDGENGLLVEQDSVESLQDSLSSLLSDSSHRERLGRVAREDVTEYDWKTVAERTKAIYTSVLEETRA